MISITQGLTDNKVQVTLNDAVYYEFTNAMVELKGAYLLIKSGGNTLVKFWSNECEWFIHTETP